MATAEEIYCLFFKEGMNHDEIANKLNMTSEEVAIQIRSYEETRNIKSIQGEW